MNFFKCLKACLLSDDLKEKGKARSENLEQKDSSKPEPEENGEYVSFEQFSKLDIRLGKIIKAEKVEGSDKLIKCTVDFGSLGTRTIVSGIYEFRKPEEIEGKSYLYITNLKPRKIFGIESQGMLIALSDEDGSFAMLVPDSDIKSGAKAG